MAKLSIVRVCTPVLLLLTAQLSWALDNGVYTIASKYTGKLVEVGNADTSDGANVNQWPSNGHATQQWTITNVSGNDYSVVNLNSGKAMEVYNFDTADGANVSQWTYWGGAPQLWTITDRGNGYYSFVNKYTGKSLDLLDWDSSDGANIGQWTYWGGDTQLWSLAQLQSNDIPNINFATPTFTNIAVHDPSVIVTAGYYYVFGSHLSVAKSTDMQNWTRVAEGVNSSNKLFNNVTSELSEALTWAETSTLWAPDVAWVNGKFMMYYNACRGDSPLSAMGIASASSIEGPYSDQGVFLKSGMWGQTSEDGTVYDATVHPNVVDPAVFFDQTGRLWMMYGSYSGGIFIMELNPSTGFPYSGQGYGKHLLGGNHARIEGAYVIYSPDSGYYYMFTSYGGLAADGGYNIRVARSVYPDGPYYDAKGTNMANVKGAAGTVFDDASIAPHGVKLMGNHLFANSNSTLGYVSPGHNSAWYDAANDQYFLFFHTRFPGRGEEHEVRVHEFFINADGWPVVAPLRYGKKVDADNSGLSASELEAVASAEIAGTYQLVNHGKDISATIKSSSNITLSTSNYSYTPSTRAITLVISGVTYKGVVSRQWNQYKKAYVVTFTALSSDGTAVWGIKSS